MGSTYSRSALGIDSYPRRGVNFFVKSWQFSLLKTKAGKLLLLLPVLLICATRAYVGLVGSRMFSHDAFMLFDGAWRMLNGQRPHIDFYSHLGFLAYAPTILGLRLSHGTAWGLGYGQAFVALLLSFWTYLVGRKRLTDVPLVLMCISVALLTAAPFSLGWFVSDTSPAMTYNRFGYALIALCLLESFADNVVDTSSRTERLGGISTGLVIGILLFLKITAFAIAVLFTLGLIPCRKQTNQRWTGIVGGFVGLSIICSAYLSFRLTPMLNDLITIAGAKHIHFSSYMLDEILGHAGAALAFSIGASLLLTLSHQNRKAMSVILLGLLVSFSGIALILSNAEATGFPLTAFLAILISNELAALSPTESATMEFFRFSVMLFGAVFISASLFSGTLGASVAVVKRIQVFHRLPPLDSPILDGFVPAGGDLRYTDLVNDGLFLVRKFRQPDDTIMSLDFTNPFSYGLAMKPAPGGTPVLQYETTFSDRFALSAAKLFGSAKLLAMPKVFSDPTLDISIPRLYGGYLHSHFKLIGESRDWLLYRHN